MVNSVPLVFQKGTAAPKRVDWTWGAAESFM